MYLIAFFYIKYILNSVYTCLNSINYLLILLNKFWFNNLLILLLIFFYIKLDKFNHLFFGYLLLLYIITVNFKWYIIMLNFNVGLMKIHPPLLYISIVLLIYYICNKYARLNIFFILSITILTFILGSFWALYQKIWGLYWSNDSIEILLVVLCFSSIYYTHKLTMKLVVHLNFIFICFIICLFLLRLNYIYTKHNFFNIQLLFNKFINILFFSNMCVLIYSNYYKLKFLFLQKISYYFIILSILLILVVTNQFNIFSIKKFYVFFASIIFIKLFIYSFLSIKNLKYFHIIVISIILIFNNFNSIFLCTYINLLNLHYNIHLNLYTKYSNLFYINYNFFNNLNFYTIEQFPLKHKVTNLYSLSQTRVTVVIKNLINYF